MRDSGDRVGAWVYTGLPGHCSPFQRSPARRQLISQRQHAATRKQTKWHDLPRQNRGQKSCKCPDLFDVYQYFHISTNIQMLFGLDAKKKYHCHISKLANFVAKIRSVKFSFLLSIYFVLRLIPFEILKI